MLEKSFREIENIKWLPWVGHNYLSLNKGKKLLIVGESHYYNPLELGSFEKHQDINFTKEIVKELAIEREYYQTKIFPNLHRAIFKNDAFDSQKFWDLVSFYNFIQRPMESNKERPTYEDYYNSWLIFFEILPLLVPDYCLFIGNTSANSLNHALMVNSNLKCESVKREDKIGNSYPKYAEIENLKGNKVKMIFIKHTSKYFSWSKWNFHLENKFGDLIRFFEDEIK